MSGSQRWRTLSAALLIPAVMAAPRIYMRVDVQQVPIERLSTNLRIAMEREPRNPQWVHNLARAHAMAWATRSATLPVVAGVQERFPGQRSTDDTAAQRRATDSSARAATEVWFGYGPSYVPFTNILQLSDAKRLRIARAHQDTALRLYKQALALDSTSRVIRLGRAWLLSHTAARREAVAELRRVVKEASTPGAGRTNGGPAFGPSLLAEAAEYLVPLLHPVRDRDEIARLRDQIRAERKRPRLVTPIAIPLLDGLSARDIEDTTAAVLFDADGTGVPKPWTWIRTNAAWLVHDPLHTGKVTSALQLFGSVTFWMFWDNGYDALASLDDDHSGSLDGRELSGLALWHDVNRNGVSDRGEVQPLSTYGIVSLQCRGLPAPEHANRIVYAPSGVTYRDGTTRATYDLILSGRAVRTSPATFH